MTATATLKAMPAWSRSPNVFPPPSTRTGTWLPGWAAKNSRVVLNDIGEEAALSTAETMRAGVERLFGPTQNAVRRPVTVSIGLAYRNAAKYKTLAELMDEADIAVYRAKVAGRNRVSPSPQVARQESA
jgi:hypothetical protein